MINKIKNIYKDENYLLQRKALYLFIFNFFTFIITILILLYSFLTSPVFNRPGYLFVLPILVIILILILLKNYSAATKICSIIYPIAATMGLFWGTPEGNQIIYFPLIISTIRITMNKPTVASQKSQLSDIINRITAISKIHNTLYKADNYSEIDFKKYIEELIKQIIISFNEKRAISITTAINIDTLNIKYALPCGIIINEAITNSIKHAFSNREDGIINIFFDKKKDNQFNLQIKDNGTGLPEIFNHGSSIGLTIINSLINQIKCKINYITQNGTTINISFPGEG